MLLDEFEKAVLAEAEFFGRYAARTPQRGVRRRERSRDRRPPSAEGHTFLERMLDRIERAGNKMPNPAILFLWLCVVVIVLSQILYWFDVKATYQVVEPPPVAAEQIYYGGSSRADLRRAARDPSPPTRYGIVTETAKVKGLLTGEGVRYLFTSFVSNFRNFAAGRDHAGGDDRRRAGGGGRADRRR